MVGLAFYIAVLLIDGSRYPTIQVTFQKLGQVTTFAWMGLLDRAQRARPCQCFQPDK